MKQKKRKIFLIRFLQLTLLTWFVAGTQSISFAAGQEGIQGIAGLNKADIESILLAAITKKSTKKKSRKNNKSKRIKRSDGFDHLLTGFSLFGAHINVECEACHQRGILRGTPKQCQACHGHPGMRASTTKSFNHVPTQQPCEICHTAVTWTGARFDHFEVTPGSCVRCHNGAIASGSPTGNHPTTTESCDACHPTGGSWHPAMFRHRNVAPGSCLTCHGITATGKPSGHMVTTESCDVCHSTNAWLPANSHGTGVAPGSCNNCHTSYPGGHFVVTIALKCDDCHRDTNWLPLRGYSHIANINHNPGVSCTTCHTSNSSASANWTFIAYKPTCAGCHYDKYKEGPHKKSELTGLKYTVDELLNCTGSCHVYVDDTFTTIEKTRNNKHNPGDGGF